jgi:HSP90 family molecular chaperone
MGKVWLADKLMWTPDGMRSCPYEQGDYVSWTDYVRRMTELQDRIYALEEEIKTIRQDAAGEDI